MSTSQAPSRNPLLNLSEGAQARLLSAAGAVAVVLLWVVGGSYTHFLPSAGKVLGTLPSFLGSASTWHAVEQTWVRVVLALLIGLALGMIAALVMWRAQFLARVVSAYVAGLMSIPSTVTALIAVFVFRNHEIGAIAVLVFTVAPFMATYVYGGLQKVQTGLLEMAEIYRLPRHRILTEVVLPQVAGSVMTAIRNEHAHAWKVVVVAELFVAPSGMGFEFNRAFSRFDLVEVIQWLFVFAGILLASEYFVIRPIESRAYRWKESR